MLRLVAQVEVLLDGELFIARTLGPGRALRVGPDPRADIPTEALTQTLPLLVAGPEGYGLRLASPLTGAVRVEGRLLRIEDGLLVDPRPEPLLLRAGDLGELVLGPSLRLRFRIHRADRTFTFRPRLEGRLAACLGGTLLAAVLSVLAVSRLSPPPQPKARELRLTTRPAALAALGPTRPSLPSSTTEKRVSAPRTRRVAHRARPASKAEDPILRRGVLGMVDRSLRLPLDRLSGRSKGARDPLAAMDAILASSAGGGLPGAATSAAEPRPDRLGDWLHRSMPRQAEPAMLTRVLRRLDAAGGPSAAARGLGPSREELRQVVAAGSAEIRVCYERELLSAATPREGRLVLHWTVGADGRAADVAVERDTLGLDGLRSCVISRVRAWVFPRCPDGCTLVYPFEFYSRV